MAEDVVTLTQILGKPDFQPAKRMETLAQNTILAHLSSRRSENPFPVTTDDLTTLIEKHVDELDVYADLSALGEQIEGVTLFRSGQRPIVRIAAELNEALSVHRLKSTLSHELGHVLLHDPLFQQKSQGALFGDAGQAQQVSFRDGFGRAEGDLFEYQAWFMCGAFLMPISALTESVRSVADRGNHYSEIWQESQLGQQVIAEVSTSFGVSSQLARIRLLKAQLITENEPAPSLF